MIDNMLMLSGPWAINHIQEYGQLPLFLPPQDRTIVAQAEKPFRLACDFISYVTLNVKEMLQRKLNVIKICVQIHSEIQIVTVMFQ